MEEHREVSQTAVATDVLAVALLSSAFALSAWAMVADAHASTGASSCAAQPFLTHVAPASGKRTAVFRRTGSNSIFYRSGMAIDADGAPNAYHPRDIGIDALV